MTLLKYGRVQTSLSQSSLPAVAQHMFSLMLRNMSSDGFVFTDPNAPGDFSAPGCIIAAPTFAVGPAVNQDYVHNWTRDAANTAIELAAASIPAPGRLGHPASDRLRELRKYLPE